MIPVQFKNIRLIEGPEGLKLGFHTETLEVGELSSELLADLERASQDPSDRVSGNLLDQLSTPAMQEFFNWSQQSLVQDQGEPRKGLRPRVLTINSTQLCNLRCKYCAAGGDGSYGDPLKKFDLDKGLPSLRWFLNQCSAGSSFQIQFLGGEPLLFPEVVQAIAHAAQKMAQEKGIHLVFGVVTNGTQFHRPEVISLVCEFRMAVTISLDGPPEVQDRFRPQGRGRGSSRAVTEGLETLFEHKKSLSSVSFSAVFHSQSLQVLETFNYFLNWPFDRCELTYSHGAHEEKGSQEFSQNLRVTIAHAYERGGEVLIRKIKSVNHLFQKLDDQVLTLNYCGAGKSSFAMDARGQVFNCPWDINELSKKINLPKEGQADRDLFESSRDQITRGNCQRCWARFLCGGGCQFIHDRANFSKGALDTHFCDRTKSLIETIIYYYYLCRRDSDGTH